MAATAAVVSHWAYSFPKSQAHTGGGGVVQLADTGSQSCVVQLVMNNSTAIISPAWIHPKPMQSDDSSHDDQDEDEYRDVCQDPLLSDPSTRPNHPPSSPSECEQPCSCPICKELDACFPPTDDDNDDNHYDGANGDYLRQSGSDKPGATKKNIKVKKLPKRSKRLEKSKSRKSRDFKTSKNVNAFRIKKPIMPASNSRGRLMRLRAMSKMTCCSDSSMHQSHQHQQISDGRFAHDDDSTTS